MRLEQFVKNRNAFPADELGRYTGQHVAWSSNGTRVLTSDPDPFVQDPLSPVLDRRPVQISRGFRNFGAAQCPRGTSHVLS